MSNSTTTAGNRGNVKTDANARKHAKKMNATTSRGSQLKVHRTERSLLSCTDLRKSYHKAQVEIPVLRGVDFEVDSGDFKAIVGQSGSGKSTLLHLLATLDRPDTGEIHFEGNRIDNLSARGRDTLRNRYLSMVFQFYHLLPELTTVENVLLPAMISCSTFKYWAKKREFKARALELLDVVGLSHRLKHRPRELSGGEMQRVAIARSLMLEPKVLLADEPTGNLDRKTGDGIMSVLRNLNQKQGLTIVMVTHDQSIADQADSMLRMVEGRIETQKTARRAS